MYGVLGLVIGRFFRSPRGSYVSLVERVPL